MAVAPHRRLDAEDASGPKKIINPEVPLVDEVPQGMDYKKLFSEEKFMNERVKIVLHPGQDLSEIGVPVGVNGKRVYLVPNQPQAIPRTHVAQLLKARPDYVMHTLTTIRRRRRSKTVSTNKAPLGTTLKCSKTLQRELPGSGNCEHTTHRSEMSNG